MALTETDEKRLAKLREKVAALSNDRWGKWAQSDFKFLLRLYDDLKQENERLRIKEVALERAVPDWRDVEKAYHEALSHD